MNEEDMIFPEGGFPTMAELTASTEPQDVSTACSSGAQGEGKAPKEGCDRRRRRCKKRFAKRIF